MGGEWRAGKSSSATPHRSHDRLHHPPPTPATGLYKNCLPRNWSLAPKMLGTAALESLWMGAGHQENQLHDSRVRTISLTPPGFLGEGLEVEFSHLENDLLNRAHIIKL